MQSYPFYKGLQKPLTYRGFKGKFIFFAIASLVAGLVFGAVLGALVNMILGGAITVVLISAGLVFTLNRQKSGLHNKGNFKGTLVHKPQLKIDYAKKRI